jgi:hypothetical protein
LSKYGEVFGIIIPSPLNSRFNLEISDFSLWYISHLFGTSLVSCSGVFLSSLKWFWSPPLVVWNHVKSLAQEFFKFEHIAENLHHFGSAEDND